MIRKNATFRLEKSVIEKIKILAYEKGLSQAGVINFLVDGHFADRSVEHLLLRDTIAELLDERLLDMKGDLRRVRLASNSIDRGVKIQMELWNHTLILGDAKKLASTEEHKTIELIAAEELVEKRIAKSRKIKLSNEQP